MARACVCFTASSLSSVSQVVLSSDVYFRGTRKSPVGVEAPSWKPGARTCARVHRRLPSPAPRPPGGPRLSLSPRPSGPVLHPKRPLARKAVGQMRRAGRLLGTPHSAPPGAQQDPGPHHQQASGRPPEAPGGASDLRHCGAAAILTAGPPPFVGARECAFLTRCPASRCSSGRISAPPAERASEGFKGPAGRST